MSEKKYYMNALSMAIQKNTKVARYHGAIPSGAHRSKSWATKLVDRVFETLSTDELLNLTPEEKKFMVEYLADRWYYPKYTPKVKALTI